MAKDKLAKVNVPELFFTHFLQPQVDHAPADSVITVLANTAAKPRGRGMTRVLEGLTLTQWEELYELAVQARASMTGSDRETTLRAAICAKVLTERMEAAGVANPRPYVPTRTRKAKQEEAPVTTNTPATDDSAGEDEGDSTTAALNTVSEEATDDAEGDDTDLSSTIPDEPATAVVDEDAGEDGITEPTDEELAELTAEDSAEGVDELTDEELAELSQYFSDSAVNE